VFSEVIEPVIVNKKAKYEYHILDKWVAGIALRGSEVKSIREKRVSFADSFARVKKGEVFLYNLHISRYAADSSPGYDPKRERKLLLHKREIKSLAGTLSQKGLTLIPLCIYFVRGKVKVELGLAKGKRLYDKREKIKERIVQREIRRVLKGQEF